MSVSQPPHEWFYPRPPLPSLRAPHIEDARAYLQDCVRVHGSQAHLARLCGKPIAYINAVVRRGEVPSSALAVALERVLGLPAAWWWAPAPWTWLRARDALAERLDRQGWPGQLGERLGIGEDEIRALIAGERRPDARLAVKLEKITEAPAEAWML